MSKVIVFNGRMTEEQAREAVRLIKKLDAAISLNAKIHEQYKKAKQGDKEALEWLTNTALELQGEIVSHLRSDISAI